MSSKLTRPIYFPTGTSRKSSSTSLVGDIKPKYGPKSAYNPPIGFHKSTSKEIKRPSSEMLDLQKLQGKIEKAYKQLLELQETLKELKLAVEVENIGLRFNKLNANKKSVNIEIERLKAKQKVLDNNIKILIEEYNSINYLQEVD